jgi:hypothetical protein
MQEDGNTSETGIGILDVTWFEKSFLGRIRLRILTHFVSNSYRTR